MIHVFSAYASFTAYSPQPSHFHAYLLKLETCPGPGSNLTQVQSGVTLPLTNLVCRGMPYDYRVSVFSAQFLGFCSGQKGLPTLQLSLLHVPPRPNDVSTSLLSQVALAILVVWLCRGSDHLSDSKPF